MASSPWAGPPARGCQVPGIPKEENPKDQVAGVDQSTSPRSMFIKRPISSYS